MVQAWLPTYDQIVLVNAVDPDSPDDGFGEIEPARRLKIRNLLREWLETYAALGLVKRLELI